MTLVSPLAGLCSEARKCPFVAGTATALPPHHYSQAELTELARAILPDLSIDRQVLDRFFRRAMVRGRYLALPADRYTQLSGLEQRNQRFIEVALELAERAVAHALADAETDARDVAMFMSTTVTGIAVPSLEARLMNRLSFSPALKRIPLFGLGCLAGAAGVARCADYLRAYPGETAILLSVELCSLTVQRNDDSIANIISAGLFGDGAAAVVLAGERRASPGVRGPRIVGSRSHFFPDTERVMGWDVVDDGFKIVLSPDVPRIAREEVRPLVDAFLHEHGLERADIVSWIAHPGGPAVIDALREGLDLTPEQLAPTRDCLADVGNLSSASVLFLLDECRRVRPGPPGSHGLMLAMGPAFSAELVLVQW